MATKKETLPDYWSVYKAINFKRFSSNREYTDKKSGEVMSYSFVGTEKIRGSIFMQLFSALLWLSPVLVIIMMSLFCLWANPFSLLAAIPLIILYHFAAMYYVIRGPHIIISPVKKKGLFSRK